MLGGWVAGGWAKAAGRGNPEAGSANLCEQLGRRAAGKGCAANGSSKPSPSCFLPSGLSLPQAQVLAELFGGRGALLDPPRAATIKHLIAFQAHWDGHPQLYDQLCKVGAGRVQRRSASCAV